MRYTLLQQQRNEIILLARVLLMTLFLMSGWSKLTGFSSTVAYFDSLGTPLPVVATVIAILMETLAGVLLIIGFYTRPIAFLYVLFVLSTALVGHNYWTMVDPERASNMTHFYKSLSIIGGLLLLGVTGPGKYSLDGK